MDDYLKEALEIARAQASVRVMSEEEITSFIQKVAAGIRTVAEGVETEDQLEVLRKLGCPRAQGYLLSRPLPVEQFAALLS